MVKKIVEIALIVFVLSIVIFVGKTTEASAEELTEMGTSSQDSSQFNTTAACKNVSLSIFSQNNVTNKVTFKVTGTPGAAIFFAVHKFGYPDKGVYYFSGTLPSTGTDYYTTELSDDYYDAYAEQSGYCTSRAVTGFFSTK